MRNHTSKRAFTIVELLTVMGVIAMLIGLLVPSLNLVRNYAKVVRQKAQFHSIAVALEMFKNDESDYPESGALPLSNSTANVTTGAQRLAEALVGRDLQGYDPKSSWDAAKDYGDTTQTAYAATGDQAEKDSLDRRKGPYLTLENVGAFSIDQLYPGVTTTVFGDTANDKPAPFITDVWVDRQVTLTIQGTTPLVSRMVKAGTPILYFKANPSNKTLLKNGTGGAFVDRTYNIEDNLEFLKIGRMMSNAAVEHPFSLDGTTYRKFYDTITNPQVVSTEGVAYNANSFILMSAGKDGLFGTADDVYNFGE